MNGLQTIQNKIYELRGQKIMLDRDLAIMYGVETKALKQAVNRNINRFPPDFMFELTKDEFQSLRSQIVTSKGRGGTRYMPYAFTEQGVAMLSSVLNSETAIQVNICIIRAFVAARQMIALPRRNELKDLQADVKKLKDYIEEILTDQNDINEETSIRLELIEQTLAELQAKPKAPSSTRRRIGFRTDADD